MEATDILTQGGISWLPSLPTKSPVSNKLTEFMAVEIAIHGCRLYLSSRDLSQSINHVIVGRIRAKARGVLLDHRDSALGEFDSIG